MKQIKMKKITGKITVITGLHIGAGGDTIQIGGIDSAVVKNPITGIPYIPGSSIKGKMRSLLEWKLGIVANTNGNPCSCGKSSCKICRVFGSGNSSDKDNIEKGPTRLIVRDSPLSEETVKKYNKFTEEKAENNINRITAKAVPRFIERVVPGVEFDFELAYRVIDTGDNGATDEKYFKDVVLEGLRMLQNDYLGGGGTRGNGQIEFSELVDENGKEINLSANAE